MSDKEHSPLGASSCERFWNCPGSMLLIQEHGFKSETTIYAAEGTVAHRLGENCLKHGIPLDGEIGKFYEEESYQIEITEEMVEAVSVYTDYIQELVEDGYRILIEHPIHLDYVDSDAWGTCDCIAVKDDHIMVIDYKHGQGKHVEIENNKQLLYYALGAMYEIEKEHKREGHTNRRIRNVTIVVIQPRKKHKDGPVRQSEISEADVAGFEQGLTDAIRRIRAKDIALSSGSHCFFCPAKVICPAYRAEIRNTADLDFADIVDVEIEPPRPESLTAEQIATVIKNAEKFDSWVRAVESYALQAAKRGVIIPGYKLVRKRANRRWKDEDAVARYGEMLYGQDIYNVKLKSPAQMEKLFGKRYKKELDEFTETPDGGETLTEDDDPREAITVKDDFDDCGF